MIRTFKINFHHYVLTDCPGASVLSCGVGRYLVLVLVGIQNLCFTVALSNILQHQAYSPHHYHPCLSPVSKVTFRQARVVLGADGT